MDAEETEKFLADLRIALSDIDDLPVGEHADRYNDLHRTLDSALSSAEGL